MNKKNLRQALIIQRDSIKNKHEKDDKIFNAILSLKVFQENNILCYYSVGSEVNTLKILEHCFETGKNIALCKIEKQKQLSFYKVNSFKDIKKDGLYNIPEPDETMTEKVETDAYGLCIVPALCFDELGDRIGYGGGYYDRFLSQYKATKLGVCYHEMIVPKLPAKAHDVKVDILVDETGVKNFAAKG